MTNVGETNMSEDDASSCGFTTGALDSLPRGICPESRTIDAASVRSTRARDRHR